MESMFSRTVFEIDGEEYCWDDVVLNAMRTGRWAALDRAVREGLACLRCEELTGAPIPEDKIDEAAAEFRYERELITAEEAEAWLAERGLDVDRWLDWIRREVLREEWRSRLDELVRTYPMDPDEVLDAARVDLICATRGNELSWDLAERVAAAAAAPDAEVAEIDDPDISAFLPRLPGWDPERIQRRLALVGGIEEAAARFREEASRDEERIHKELEIGRLEWIRLDCRVMLFPNDALAREAVLCVKEDGLPIDQVAADAHALVHEMRFYLGELDPDLRPRLLAAAPSELIGPVPFEEQVALFLVLDKLLPREDEPALRREIERRAVARAVAEQVTQRIHWADR